VQVSQQRFFLDPQVKPQTQQTWTIPVCFAAGAGQAKCSVMDQAQQAVSVPAGSLIYPDAGGRGYYRFTLPNSVYAEVAASAETDLTPEERISLLGDQWAGVRSNHDAVGDYLNLVAALKDDTNPAVISTAVRPLAIIDQQIAQTPQEKQAIAAWVVKTFKPAYTQLGPPAETDTPDKRELRAALFGLLGSIGEDPEVIAQAKTMAEQALKDPGSVDPNLAQTAMALAAANGDASFFDELQHTYETAQNPQRQERALELLATFRNPELEKRSLEYAVSGKVRNQDAVFQFILPLMRPQTRDVAWDFIRNNWDKVQAQLTTSMGAYLVGSTGAFCSEEKKQEVASFFATHKVAAASRSLTRAQDAIDACVELRKDQGPKLEQWIAQEQR
ncbi:MAG TPA: ERAP1-like C-terminal domain-containing protein, partial [Acidobacteriaceae bacterium]|nr:ERAP1-like C-terminal domain-containing protein [Acidobacteriaceae bacterium]